MSTYRGTVVKKAFGTGSKSERQSVMLRTDTGEYVLRQQGGNPFTDPALEALAGAEIECDGSLHGYTLIITSWKKV